MIMFQLIKNTEVKMEYSENKVYLIHGYTANPKANWFPWIQNQVEENFSITFNIVEMPNSDHPDVEEWDKKTDEVISPSTNITIIGHSLGCIEALRFVSQHDVSNVNLILVSGFDETTNTLPELHEFTDSPLDLDNILPKIKKAVVISAIDDDIVPTHYSYTLSKHLNCKFILLPSGKHFIDRDKIFELPSVYEELQNILSQN